jgi:hypothetical protein
MKTFRDATGREWAVIIHVAAVKRCRALVGVDLYGLVDEGFEKLAKLLGDPVQLVDVLYVLCKQEADDRHLTDEDFGRSLGGDALQHATDAFLAELVDFFPDPRVRAGLQRVITAGRTVRDRMLDLMTDRLAEIDPEAEAARLLGVAASGPPRSNGSSGGLRESSASTPDPSPSAN